MTTSTAPAHRDHRAGARGPGRPRSGNFADHTRCYYCCMIDAGRWGAIRDLADRQFGLFTTAQARHLGVAPYVLARLASREAIVRIHHGVYEVPESSAWTTVGDWAAQWLALHPAADIEDRRTRPDSVVSHAAAAQVLRLGTITASGLELSSPHRINVRDPSVRTWRRPIGERGRDWDLVDGLPVTTPARTVAELLLTHGDGGHLGTALHTCLSESLVDADELIAACDRAAPRWNYASGAELFAALLDQAQMPAEPVLVG